MYVIMNNGRYVAKPGRQSSFTKSLQNAVKYSTLEEAIQNKCGNESAVKV